ncbi:hypothetical protein PGB90_003087 [Kerria lacca]
MAMLTSGEYNLTKNNVIHEKKSMIFVKLTDSAQRALNNFFREIDKCEVPIIEFNKDEGRILIPNPKDKDSETIMAQFKFNVISNVTMQGRQGRFECVQHIRGSKQLLKFGQLTQRLRIHANEDVYETTKNRMAAIEWQQRKNCTVQIDWNSTTNISRKVRIDRNIPKTLPPVTKIEETKLVPAPGMSNMIRTKSRPINKPPPQKINPAACIIRKPLKERIIHLLALKPYKQSELEAALKKDGLRECDKPHLMETLMSVSISRENTYHLSKHAWNEVQENWLFYTEQDKQQIRKNKLRNLTSPSSSDSGISVSSNQSPNNDIPITNKYKRPGYFNGVDGFQTKRQRISHFVKQEPTKSNVFEETTQVSQNRYEECQRVNSLIKQEPGKSNVFEENTQIIQNRYEDCQRMNNFIKQEPGKSKMFDENTHLTQRRVNESPKSSKTGEKPLSNTSDTKSDIHNDLNYSSQKNVPVVIVSSPEVTSTCNDQEEDPNNISSVSNKYNCPELTPPTCQFDSSQITRLESPKSNQFASPSDNAFTWHEKKTPTVKPKYLKEYVTIMNMEQRRRYKSDFNEIFKEYQRVHEDVDSISNIFAQLGESLKQHKKGSPIYKSIEKEIFNRYYVLKQNQKYQAAKRRFDYLHEKLSHIKSLVHDYDQKMLK